MDSRERKQYEIEVKTKKRIFFIIRKIYSKGRRYARILPFIRIPTRIEIRHFSNRICFRELQADAVLSRHSISKEKTSSIAKNHLKT